MDRLGIVGDDPRTDVVGPLWAVSQRFRHFFFAFRLVQIFRTLTAFVSLMALLLGNAAAWCHVGCVSQRPAAFAEASPEADRSGHGCCHHHGASPCDRVRGKEAGSGPAELPGEPSHDADSCSICQHFYTSRVAAILPDSGPGLAEELPASPIMAAPVRMLSSGTLKCPSGRGPPSC